MGEKLDPESMRGLLSRYFAGIERALDNHGGTAEKYIGDAVMAIFGMPTVREDDALRAVRAAAEIRAHAAELHGEATQRFGVPFGVHIGVHTGVVVSGTGGDRRDRLLTGDAANVTARLEQGAGAGEILLGPVTYSLVRDWVDVEPPRRLDLKGKAERVTAFPLVEVRSIRRESERQGAVFVGRVRELNAIQADLEAVTGSRRPRAIAVVGDAGVGKSALVARAVSQAPDALLLQGRCLPYGEDITFWPLAEMVISLAAPGRNTRPEEVLKSLELFSPDDHEAASAVAQLAGVVPSTVPARELFAASRRFIEVLAAERLVVVEVDDVHRASGLLLNFLKHLVRYASAGVLVIVVGRPEMLSTNEVTEFIEAAGASTITLEPLDETESRTLMHTVAGASGLPSALTHRVFAGGEGNPLFTVETIRMLVDAGTLKRRNGAWEVTGDLDTDFPPTIAAILETRLGLLDELDRNHAERASVMGQVFLFDALVSLTDEGSDEVRQRLGSLNAAEVIEAIQETDGDAFGFRHVLLRDAAYRTSLKSLRAQMHERFARWLQGQPNAAQVSGIIGAHLERAFHIRKELGLPQDAERQLATEAAVVLGQAGWAAYRMADIRSARDTFLRASAISREGAEPRVRSAWLPQLASALAESGYLDRAVEVIGDAEVLAHEEGDDRLAKLASLARVEIEWNEPPKDWAERSRAVLSEAIGFFERTDDYAGLAWSCNLSSNIHLYLGAAASSLQAAQAAVRNAKAGGFYRATYVAAIVRALMYGPMNVKEALQECSELAADARTMPMARAHLLYATGAFAGMLGDFDVGRDQISEGAQIERELGWEVSSAMSEAELLADLELLSGAPDAADAVIAPALTLLIERGAFDYASTLAAIRSRILAALGQHDASLDAGALARLHASDDDVVTQVVVRGGLARATAASGDGNQALQLAREGVNLARTTDHANLIAESFRDQGETLSLLGDRQAALAAFEAATEHFRAKGNVAGLARLREAAERVAGE